MRRARLVVSVLGLAVMAGAGLAVLAQPPASNAPGPVEAAPPPNANPAAPPTILPPAPASNAAATEAAPPSNGMAAAKPPPSPPAPVLPVRSPAAILQALDKVTAETMRFAAPVGERVRYKNLVFTVKACETRDLGAPSPKAAAYVVIDSAPLGVQGAARPPAREVFHGWMFANSPALHPFQHPVYDAW